MTINGKQAKFLFQKMSDADFSIDASNGGSSYYGKVVCSHSSEIAGGNGTDKDYRCTFSDSDPVE